MQDVSPSEHGTIESKVFRFHSLYIQGKTGKTKQWKIQIRLVKAPVGKHGNNWNLMEDIEVPFKIEYFTGKLPEGLAVQYWVESGDVGGAITRFPPNYGETKNKGRSNEQHPLQHAFSDCMSRIRRKRENGYSSSSQPSNDGAHVSSLAKPLASPLASTQNEDEMKTVFWFPMLAREYGKEKKHIEFPCVVQPKYDGVRAVSFSSGKGITMYTRNRKEFPESETLRDIRASLADLLAKRHVDRATLYIDGELYVHGVPLQKITSMVRASKSNEQIEYHVFDLFDPAQPDLPFHERYHMLHDLVKSIRTTKIKLVPTHRASSEKEIMQTYRSYRKKGYEGVMVRNVHSIYRKGTSNNASIRSVDLLKLKEVFSDEFEVAGFTNGVHGKEVDAIIWICNTKNGKHTFTATPNAPFDERARLLAECRKDCSKYIGQLLTVEYRNVSVDGIPTQPKAIAFRDLDN
jgi:DNA ligase 1